MNDVILRKINESILEIECEDDIKHELYNRYSYYVPGYQFQPRYKLHVWDGKIHLYNKRTDSVPYGLIYDILKKGKDDGYNFISENFNIDELFDDTSDEWFDKEIKDNMKNCSFGVRDYQDDAIKKAMKNKRGVLLSCTGSGKSLMIFNILKLFIKKNPKKKSVLIVPSVSLVEQMYNDFKDYGWEDIDKDVTKLYGGTETDFGANVLISTWQSLQEKPEDFFEDYKMVLVDEAHTAKASVLSKILKMCTNAEYKIGTTGTLPTDESESMEIQGSFGEVIFELRSKDLIDRGLLTEIKIGNILLKYPFDIIKKNKSRTYPEEVKFVEEYIDRNKSLKFIFDKLPKTHNTLILVNKLNHLDDVKNWLVENRPERTVHVIKGSVSAKIRESIRQGIENVEGAVIVATFSTMSTGINIPKLHEIILYSNSKSKIKVLQSIGRGLRKHATKDKVILFDVIDDLRYANRHGRIVENYLIKHWNERMKYYEEQGFGCVNMELTI